MTPQEEAYHWVVSIIHGCKTKFHFKAAYKVIDLFGELYPSEKAAKTDLIDLCSDNYNSIFNHDKDKIHP
jgi:hypothetical protein